MRRPADVDVLARRGAQRQERPGTRAGGRACRRRHVHRHQPADRRRRRPRPTASTRHRAERPAAWTTIEEPHDLAARSRRAADSFVIVDCLTLWVGNLLWRGDDDDGDHRDRRASAATAAAARACADDRHLQRGRARRRTPRLMSGRHVPRRAREGQPDLGRGRRPRAAARRRSRPAAPRPPARCSRELAHDPRRPAHDVAARRAATTSRARRCGGRRRARAGGQHPAPERRAALARRDRRVGGRLAPQPAPAGHPTCRAGLRRRPRRRRARPRSAPTRPASPRRCSPRSARAGRRSAPSLATLARRSRRSTSASARPTADIRYEAALSPERFDEVVAVAVAAVDALDTDLLVLGEIGIGNTTRRPPSPARSLGGETAAWVGRGTGVDDDGAGAQARRRPGGGAPHRRDHRSDRGDARGRRRRADGDRGGHASRPGCARSRSCSTGTSSRRPCCRCTSSTRRRSITASSATARPSRATASCSSALGKPTAARPRHAARRGQRGDGRGAARGDGVRRGITEVPTFAEWFGE